MSLHPGTLSRAILRYGEAGHRAATDALAVEEPLDIRLRTAAGSRTLAITMRTPGADADLARGFLFTEGILTDPDAVAAVRRGDPATEHGRNTVTVHLRPGVAVDWDRLQRHGYVSSSCGVCGKTSLEQVRAVLPFGDFPDRWTLPAALLARLPDRLRSAQALFAATGGIHAAGLFTPAGELLQLAEDVGRHNALDKLIGHCWSAGRLPLRRHLLVLSGRASFELVQKAAMAGLEVIAAVGAPSSLAVALAEELDITLCGFVRQGTFNCYTGAERLS